MARIRLSGITWEHRRAVDPLLATLAAFGRERPDVEVAWQARPLAGFEFQPVDELAEAHDLIVFDHPFVGEIARSRCLAPLDGLIGGPIDGGLTGAFAGPSLEGYRYGGRLWALPLDAACQVAVYRPDLLARCGEEVPRSWTEVLALGERTAAKGLRLAIALAGVHGLMTFFSLCANLGRPCGVPSRDDFADRDTAHAALEALRRLLALSPPEVLDWNSIAVQDAMAARDDLLFCPAVYGFATYAEADRARPLAYAGFTGLRAPHEAGSTLGGAGLGISAGCRNLEAAMAYAAFLARADTQRAFAAHHGQPAHAAVWRDAATNERFRGFYRATRATIDGAWIRPRHAGYLAFQRAAGDLVERHLCGAVAAADLLAELTRLYARTRVESS